MNPADKRAAAQEAAPGGAPVYSIPLDPANATDRGNCS